MAVRPALPSMRALPPAQETLSLVACPASCAVPSGFVSLSSGCGQRAGPLPSEA